MAPLGFILFILNEACMEFEERVGQLKSPRGAKTQLIKSAVNAFSGEFTVAELERACPGVKERSRDGCKISVWSTPRVPEHHAKHIRRQVDNCPHTGA